MLPTAAQSRHLLLLLSISKREREREFSGSRPGRPLSSPCALLALVRRDKETTESNRKPGCDFESLKTSSQQEQLSRSPNFELTTATNSENNNKSVNMFRLLKRQISAAAASHWLSLFCLWRTNRWLLCTARPNNTTKIESTFRILQRNPLLQLNVSWMILLAHERI